MTEQDRHIIQNGIENGSTKSEIASVIGKDKSTVGKEIKERRRLTYKCSLPLQCANYKTCTHGRCCTLKCPDYVEFKCNRRDKSPGACNGCGNYHSCRFSKYRYDAVEAHNEYRNALKYSREGFNITTKELKELGEKIMPQLKNGASVYVIKQTFPEITQSEATLYTYIESNIFKDIGLDIGPMDLRRTVSRKMPKQKRNLYKKRKDKSYLVSRTYEDYENYCRDNPDVIPAQMDTVYNDVSNGPYVQSFKLLQYSLFLGIIHDEKTAEAMVKGVDILEDRLGKELFTELFNCILTDRGSEFSDAEGFEHRDGSEETRTRVFYCNPMASCQKGSLENNHIELRYILPKGYDLRALGLNTQDDLNLVLSHINSCPKEKLNGKSPLDLVEFLNPKLYQKLKEFGIVKIDKQDLILKPILLKKK